MNRREVIRALSGGIAGLPAVKSIERLSAGPDDVIVVTYPARLKPEQLVYIRDFLLKTFSPTKIIVFDGGPGGGPEIKIVKAAE